MTQPPDIEDQTRMTELTIMPDGRVFVFGTSRELLEILSILDPRDRRIRKLLERVRQLTRGV